MTVGTAPGRQRAAVNVSHGASVREESIAARPQHGGVRTQVVCHLCPLSPVHRATCTDTSTGQRLSRATTIRSFGAHAGELQPLG